MNRITLTDKTGRWFSLDSAEKFEERPDWNGSNHVSRTVGMHRSETLYRTHGGRWIKAFTSRMQGDLERWEAITDPEAAIWLSINEYDGHPACQSEFDDLEIA